MARLILKKQGCAAHISLLLGLGCLFPFIRLEGVLVRRSLVVFKSCIKWKLISPQEKKNELHASWNQSYQTTPLSIFMFQIKMEWLMTLIFHHWWGSNPVQKNPRYACGTEKCQKLKTRYTKGRLNRRGNSNCWKKSKYLFTSASTAVMPVFQNESKCFPSTCYKQIDKRVLKLLPYERRWLIITLYTDEKRKFS